MTCAIPIDAAVYNGRDNIISLVLDSDGNTITDLSGVTRVTVDMDGGTTIIDSDVVGGGVIWWTDQVTFRGVLTDVLRLQFGDQGITAGVYNAVVIVVYDAVYTNGLRIENNVKITVVA